MTQQEAIEKYHEWRLLKQRVAKLETTLKKYTDEHGDIPVAPSKVWGPQVSLSESVNAEAPDFQRSMRHMLGDVYELAVKTSMPKQALEAACSLLAKRQGLSVKEVNANMWGDLKALGFVVAEHKTVYAERSIDL
jgi:hypothetical protein